MPAVLLGHKRAQVNGRDPTFRHRFVAAVAQRPLRLAFACLATTGLAPAMVVSNAATGAGRAAADATAVQASEEPTSLGAGQWQEWFAAAEEAAATCPGLPPEVLVAVAEVETGLGIDNGPSSAGAVGPMQFLPATWSAYGADGDGDGAADIGNARDALHGAAALLCANGGGDPKRLRSALWNYNHSHAYVDEVLQRAGLPS